MHAAPLLDPPASAPHAALDGAPGHAWDIRHVGVVDSTNRLASHLPAWTAVVAADQTAGRGRYHRPWTSGLGGLWLSAVLPCPGPASHWTLLPLAAGLALLDALEPLGLPGLRLRWPNDLLAADRKLAGILVERHDAHTAVVGIGLNLHNRPAALDPTLANVAVRLADFLPEDAPSRLLSPDHHAARLLSCLAKAHALLAAGDTATLADRLNKRWTKPIPVRLTLDPDGTLLEGDFLGILPNGSLRLDTPTGPRLLDPLQIRLLREIENRKS